MHGGDPSQPRQYDRVFGEIRLHEIAALFVVSIIGGAVVGAAATWNESMLGTFFGALAGYFASPITMFVLFRRRCWVSAALLFGVPSIVGAVSDPWLLGIGSSWLASVAFLVMAGVIPFRYPKRDRPVHLCRVCEYDLRGNVSGSCPECGCALHRVA